MTAPEPADTTRVRFLPDIRGLGLTEAAVLLADNGIYLLLVVTGKHPGSYVGKGWPAKSTCNPDTVAEWCSANPDAGIAIHTGRSGLVAVDLDVDVIPSELAWLEAGLFQSTRGGLGSRGHYVFASSEIFTSGKIKLADGTTVGEVRSGNTVILTQPSPHPKKYKGGEYRWITTGVVPELPEEAYKYLTSKAGVLQEDAVEEASVRTKADLAAYYDSHTAQPEPWRRKSFRAKYAEYRTLGERRHDAMMKVLFWAARQVEDGLVSADIFDDLHGDWSASFGPGERTPPPNEFGRMVVEAIACAAKEDRDDLRRRHRREFGTDHRDFIGVFDGLEFHVEGEGADQTGKIASADSNRSEAGTDRVNGNDPDDPFWTSREILRDLREFARARRVGPWAMLGNVLARAVAAIPPHVVLPATIGGRGSLNLFVALVGASGDGKGASAAAAADWLATDPNPFTATLGSGEGMAKVFAYKSKAGGVWTQTGLRASVLFEAPEVDNLVALTTRSGSTLMPQLRSAYSGETLGFTYADPAKALRLCGHRYRLCLTVGVQPGRAAPLLYDADGGTPQRFVWLPVLDAGMPENRPDAPKLRALPSWASVAPPRRATTRLVRPPDAAALLDVPVKPSDLTELVLPAEAVAAVEGHHLARHRGENIDPLDGHKLQTRLKVAAGLMWLDGRANTIDAEDWKLSGRVMEVSDLTRRGVASALTSKANSENVSRGRAEGVRSDVAEQVKTERAIKRVADNIVRYVTAAGGEMARADVRVRLPGGRNRRDRSLFDDAETLLINSMRIEKVPSNNDGPGGHVLRLPGQDAGK